MKPRNENSLSDSRLRQARVLYLLTAAHKSGLAPIDANRLHQVAYLTNALSPVWGLEPLTAELLKLYGSPYDARLQRDVDLLVAEGLVRASSLAYNLDDAGNWKVFARYSIIEERARSILAMVEHFPDERNAFLVVHEVCQAISALPPQDVDRALGFDAAYANPAIGPNNVLDLYDEDRGNKSSRSAGLFPSPARGISLEASERAHLYVRHLHRLATRSA